MNRYFWCALVALVLAPASTSDAGLFDLFGLAGCGHGCCDIGCEPACCEPVCCPPPPCCEPMGCGSMGFGAVGYGGHGHAPMGHAAGGCSSCGGGTAMYAQPMPMGQLPSAGMYQAYTPSMMPATVAQPVGVSQYGYGQPVPYSGAAGGAYYDQTYQGQGQGQGLIPPAPNPSRAPSGLPYDADGNSAQPLTPDAVQPTPDPIDSSNTTASRAVYRNPEPRRLPVTSQRRKSVPQPVRPMPRQPVRAAPVRPVPVY